MIDQGVFANEWTVLCTRFGKYEGSRLIATRYFEHLSPRLSTEEFVHAARKLFAESEFFPKPADFVEAVGRGGRALAEADWEHARAVMYGDAGAYGKLSEGGKRAVDLMGGVRGLQSTHVDEAKWRRREFLELHEYAGAPEREALPAMTPAGRKLVRDAMAGQLAPPNGDRP